MWLEAFNSGLKFMSPSHCGTILNFRNYQGKFQDTLADNSSQFWPVLKYYLSCRLFSIPRIVPQIRATWHQTATAATHVFFSQIQMLSKSHVLRKILAENILFYTFRCCRAVFDEDTFSLIPSKNFQLYCGSHPTSRCCRCQSQLVRLAVNFRYKPPGSIPGFSGKNILA